MFVIDSPPPPEPVPLVLAQATPTANTVSSPKFDYLLTECQDIPTPSAPTSAERLVDIQQALANYLERKSRRQIDVATIKVLLVVNTMHGKLVELAGPNGEKAWRYDPHPTYVGKEQAVFAAELDGKRYRIVMTINANDFYIATPEESECPRSRMIRLK